jgi:hypothetical protein
MNNANEKQLSCVAAKVGYKTVDTFARKTRVLEKAVYKTVGIFGGRNTTALGTYIRPLLHHKRQLS